MKQKRYLLLLPYLACIATSCNVSFDYSEEGGASSYEASNIDFTPDESLEGNLNIRFFKKGFGEGYLQNVVSVFKKKYPKVSVKTASSSEPLAIYAEIIGGIETKYDLYLTEATIMDYKDEFVTLNDVYDSKVEGEELCVKDKIEKFYKDSCSQQGVYYTAPAYCGAFGFIYNRDYVDGNELPVTSDELVSLFGRLKSNSIVPMVYSGGDTSYYLNFLFSTWAAQYEGLDPHIMAQVGRVWDAEKNSYEINPTSAYLPGELKAGEVIENMVWPTHGYTIDQAVAYNANTAQNKLLNAENRIGMMYTGSWCMNEMANMIRQYEVDINNFGMMKTPVLSSIIEKCTTIENDAELSALIKAIDAGSTSLSGTGYEVNQADFDKIAEARGFVYVGSEGSRFVITKKATRPDLAKAFHKFYYTEYAIKAFNAAESGAYIPVVRSTVDVSKMSNYYKDVYGILGTKTKFFNKETALMAITPYIQPYGTSLEKAFGSQNPADRKTAQQMYDTKIQSWTANDNEKYWNAMRLAGYLE